jgi:hypothetical protein
MSRNILATSCPVISPQYEPNNLTEPPITLGYIYGPQPQFFDTVMRTYLAFGRGNFGLAVG